MMMASVRFIFIDIDKQYIDIDYHIIDYRIDDASWTWTI
jgi:hypothetical protein